MTNDIQPETPQTAHPKRLGGGRTFRGTASRSEKGNIDEVSTTSETSGVPMVRSQIDRMIRVVERSRPEIGIQLAGSFDQVAQRRMTHPRLEPEATMNFDVEGKPAQSEWRKMMVGLSRVGRLRKQRPRSELLLEDSVQPGGIRSEDVKIATGSQPPRWIVPRHPSALDHQVVVAQ